MLKPWHLQISQLKATIQIANTETYSSHNASRTDDMRQEFENLHNHKLRTVR